MPRVFSGFHGSVVVVAARASKHGDVGVSEVVVARASVGRGVPADVCVGQIGGGGEVAVDFLQSWIVFSLRVRYAAGFGHIGFRIEIAIVRAVVIDGIVDGDFFVRLDREWHIGVGQEQSVEGQVFVDAPGPVAAIDGRVAGFVLAVDSQIVDRRIADLVEEHRAGALRSDHRHSVGFESNAVVNRERTYLAGLLLAVDGDVADARALAVGGADRALHMPVVMVRHILRAISLDGQIADGGAVLLHADADVAGRNDDRGLVRAGALQGDVLDLEAQSGHAGAPNIVLVVVVGEGVFAGRQIDGLSGQNIFHSADQIARRIVFGPAAARGARSDIPGSGVYLGDMHGKGALRTVVAVPTDIIGRAGGGLQTIALVNIGILRFHDGVQIGKGHHAAAQRVDGEHGVETGGLAGTEVVDPVGAAFARSELVPNGGFVIFVFVRFHGGADIAAVGGAQGGYVSVGEVVVAGMRVDGVPADVYVNRIDSGQDIAVQGLKFGVVHAARVGNAVFLVNFGVFAEDAFVRAVVVDGVVDGDFVVLFDRERTPGVGQERSFEDQAFVGAPGPVGAMDSRVADFAAAGNGQVFDRNVEDLVKEHRTGAVGSFNGQSVDSHIGDAVSGEGPDLAGLLFAVDGDVAYAHTFAVAGADGALQLPVVVVRHIVGAIGLDGQVADGSAKLLHADADVARRNHDGGLVRAGAQQRDVFDLEAQHCHAGAPDVDLVVVVGNAVFAGGKLDSVARNDLFHGG